MIQVYGRFDHHFSHSQVSRGLVRGLLAHKIPLRIFNAWGTEATAFNKFGPTPLYEDLDDVADKLEVGHYAEADIGLFVGGYPPMIGSWLQGHRVKIALLIAESAKIPLDWARQVNASVDVVLVPSRWVLKAYRKAGVTAPIHRICHGLHREYLKPPSAIRLHDGPLVFGHVAGAASFLDRKGTPQLIEAFVRVFEPGEAILKIRTPETLDTLGLSVKGFVEVEWADVGRQKTAVQMREWYESLDYLVQPSRAEAFGICPLEARACGVPVILTRSHGHAEHVMESLDLVVPDGLEAPSRVNGIPDGMAPSVKAQEIEGVLRRAKIEVAKRRTEAHTLARANYAANWSWPAVTLPLAKVLKKLSKESEKSLDDKLGF